MLTSSKMMPSAVHIGVSNGRNEMAQQSYGSVLYGRWIDDFLPPQSVFHSVEVMYSWSLLCCFFPMGGYF